MCRATLSQSSSAHVYDGPVAALGGACHDARMVIRLPDGLDEQRVLGLDWARWLDCLPRLFSEVLDDWDLTREGDTLWHGFCSLVAPVHAADGTSAVLKVSFDGDDESRHEHLALQHWAGRGAVRLLRADPHRRAILLERLHQRTLDDLLDVEACEVVAGLWRQIHVPALPQLDTLASYVEGWQTDLGRLPRNAPVPRRLVEQALALGRELLADEASTGTLIHGDLHYQNVLAADRAEWLVIDPKPMSGDRHYEVAPMLWNRFEELGDDVRSGLRRRFHTLVDAGELDEHRARDWVVVRMVHNAMWAVEDAAEVAGPIDQEYLTMCVAVAKAVQD